jgi:uncharacterized membrane protein
MFDDGGFGGYTGMMHGSDAFAWLMLIVMAAILVALVAMAAATIQLTRRWALTWSPDDRRAVEEGSDRDRTAQRILDERLAQGEIEEDEYLRRRAALVGS